MKHGSFTIFMHGSYDPGRCYYQCHTLPVLRHVLTVAADVASSIQFSCCAHLLLHRFFQAHHLLFIHRSKNQCINQAINQSTNQATKQPTNQSINQSINQPTNQPTNQNNQSINHSRNQSINFECAEKQQHCPYGHTQVQYLLMRCAPMTRSS